MPSYNSNVPAASQTLAATQSPIQTNFATISADFNLDHYTFAATNEGYHKQITFAGNNVPGSTPTSPTSYLYTNLVSSVSQLFFLNSSGTSQQLTGNSYSLAANGYFNFPGGLQVRWGKATSSSTSNQSTSITFSTAFTTSCAGVQLTPIANTASGNTVSLTQTAPTTTGFTMYGNASSLAFYYFAIGY